MGCRQSASAFGIGNEAWSLLRTLELVEYFPKDRAALWNETSNWVPVPASEILTTVTPHPLQKWSVDLGSFAPEVKNTSAAALLILTCCKPSMPRLSIASLPWLQFFCKPC